MTLADGNVPVAHPSVPRVRAPRALHLADDPTAGRETPAVLVQRALGLGAPGSHGEASPHPIGDAIDGQSQAPAEAARSAASPELRDGRPVPASLPTSPADHDGIYRSLVWVSWAVEECSRAFTRLTSRLGDVERRVEAAERKSEAAPAPVFDADRVDERDAAQQEIAGHLERLEVSLDQARADASRRVGGVEERLRQLDFVPLKVSNLQRTVDQLAAMERRTRTGDAVHAATAESSDVAARELRRELAIVQRRLAELDARLRPESIAANVADEVERQAERFVLDSAGGTGELERVYRELDAVAEFVAARAACTAESVERIGPLEIAVLELRRDLGRAVAVAAPAELPKAAALRIEAMEARLARLELSDQRANRLYSALQQLVEVQAVGPVVTPETGALADTQPNGAAIR